MKRLDVTAIQRGCVYDGTGVRTTVFLKGYPFSCPWCCNPETLYTSPSFFIDNKKCIKEKGWDSPLCKKCIRKGGFERLEHCPFGVSEATSHPLSVEELTAYLLRDKSVYQLSGGGVTFSGGDPIIHISELFPLLEKLKEEQIHCAIETTLYCKDSAILSESVSYINEWIVDLKFQKENYREDYDDVMTFNLRLLRNLGVNISFRLVFVESMEADEIVERLKKLGVLSLEVLKCHALAESKYTKLGLPFRHYVPSTKSYLDFITALLMAGVDVRGLSL